MTLSPDPGGVFDTLLGLARLGLGGRSGDGRQFMSWMHDDDFTAAVRWLIDREDIEGVVTSQRRIPCRMRSSCGYPADVWRPLWPAGEEMDARNRRCLHAYGNRADSEEPKSCSSAAARAWLHIHVPRVARRRVQSLSAVEDKQGVTYFTFAAPAG